MSIKITLADDDLWVETLFGDRTIKQLMQGSADPTRELVPFHFLVWLKQFHHSNASHITHNTYEPLRPNQPKAHRFLANSIKTDLTHNCSLYTFDIELRQKRATVPMEKGISWTGMTATPKSLETFSHKKQKEQTNKSYVSKFAPNRIVLRSHLIVT